MPRTPTEIWQEFRTGFHSANERLAAEMAAAAADVRSLIDQLQNQLASDSPGQFEPGEISSFERLFGETENRLFSGPLGKLEKLGPTAKALSAMEEHRSEMNDLARRLPPVMAISGAELAQIIGPDAQGSWRRAWVKRSQATRPLKLRRIVFGHLGEQAARRARIDGAFELVLSQAGLHLVAAWQSYRRHQLAILANGDRDKATLARERRWWSRTASALVQRIERLVRAYRQWAEASPARLAKAVLCRSRAISSRRLAKIAERWQADFSYWHRQERAVRAVIDLERQLSLVAREAIRGSGQALDSLRAEHGGVDGELDRAIAWLQTQLEQNNREPFPPPQAALLSAEQRARDWSDHFSSFVRISVPAFVETVRPARALPGWRKPWRQLRPQQVLLSALSHAGLQAARDGFREAETEHIAVIRDIEQARQVVTFALEAEREGSETVQNLPREAATNAIALLEHRKQILIDPLPAAESGLSRAQALTLLETHTALETGRLGLFALLTRQGAPRVIRNLGRSALDSIRAASRGLWRVAGDVLRWASWKLGWEMPVSTRGEPVVERTLLSDVLEVQLKARELPPLYQRLFRLAPVEDQRFLVGREVEMSGLSRAFSLWQSGRSVTVLVVGARGSGKTSLLNCASSVAFPGMPVARGQFCGRIRSADQMSEFLRELFHLPAGADLTTALNQEQRVAVIEEFERSFLRCMNGFGALREFLRLVGATSGSTLWVLSLNQLSFRYLDASLGLSRNFSHRVNAMSVSQEHMVEAILQRHTLSGLRLRFAPAPPGDPRVHGLRRFFGLERSSQQVFFDALYRQSEGLFRSAFELWLGSIGRVEGGVVHMVQPLDPSYSRLEAELKPDDLFTLQAILQHASLAAEEVAEVFGIGVEEARSRLERLLALEILEPEPAGPGLRVRPQAGCFVRDTLARQNLS
ncbi:MAG TPA: ATP-binding protein [Patescibacteria group bacterium]|nr:ATP-binding protein [Patescibacteria group bacterium]